MEEVKKIFQNAAAKRREQKNFFYTLLPNAGGIRKISKHSRRFAEASEIFQSRPANWLSLKNFFNTFLPSD